MPSADGKVSGFGSLKVADAGDRDRISARIGLLVAGDGIMGTLHQIRPIVADGHTLGLRRAVIGELSVIEGHRAVADRPGLHLKDGAARLTALIGDGHGIAAGLCGRRVGIIGRACPGGAGPADGGCTIIVGVGGHFCRIAVGPVFDVDNDGETFGFDHQFAVFEPVRVVEVLSSRHVKVHLILTDLGGRRFAAVIVQGDLAAARVGRLQRG